MLNICELYALEHDIVFNPGKTRCMHFHNGNLHPGSVYFMNNRLQFTETCSLLGINVLPDFKADINAAVQQFNVKCISMLLDFKHLQCDVLSKLIGVYCLDVYGSQLWDYESGRAEVFYVAWRKAMRRVWQLSNVTHCSLLPIICNCLPSDITLEKRFLKFIWNCFNNSNTIVQIIVNISMKNRKSVLGINFRYLAFKYKIKSNYWQEDWKHIERCIFNYAETTRSDSDYYVGNTVRELNPN